MATNFIKFKEWKSQMKQNENQTKLSEDPYIKLSSDFPDYHSSVKGLLVEGQQSMVYSWHMHVGMVWLVFRNCTKFYFGSSDVPPATLYRFEKMQKLYDFVPRVQVIFIYNCDSFFF